MLPLSRGNKTAASALSFCRHRSSVRTRSGREAD